LLKTKKPTRLKSENEPVEIPKEPESESSTPPKSELPTNRENSDNSDDMQIVKQETLEVPELPLESDALAEPKKVNDDATLGDPESALAAVSSTTAKRANPTEKSNSFAAAETAENSEVSPTAESLSASGEPIKNEPSAKPEELTMEELIEESAPELKPESGEDSEEAVNLETPTELENNERDDTLVEIEASTTHKLSRIPSLPINTEKFETSNDLTFDETIKELEPDVAPDLPETSGKPTEEEFSSGSDEQLSDESLDDPELDDPEVLSDDEMEEPTDQSNIPGHRMFLEDRRRRRKR
jgi:hypothetical protein